MPSKSCKWHILLFSVAFFVLADLGFGKETVVRDGKFVESQEELDDLNKKVSIPKDSSGAKLNEPRFTHRDEDMLADLKQSTIFESLKSDVEILESSEVKKQDMEIEERYRAPAIILNTDKFINEDIEVNAGNIDSENPTATNALTSSHLILVIALTAVGFLAVGLFVALVAWRNYTQQRYGMRELLVTNDNQDYWPQDVMTSVVALHQQQYREQQQEQNQQQQQQS